MLINYLSIGKLRLVYKIIDDKLVIAVGKDEYQIIIPPITDCFRRLSLLTALPTIEVKSETRIILTQVIRHLQ